MIQWLPRLVARLPASVHAKLLVAFLVIAGLLVAVSAVGLRVLGETNRRAEELILLHRKIAAYRQLQHDTTGQLYSVTAALALPLEQVDMRMIEAPLRQLKQFGYDLDRLQYVAQDEATLLSRIQEEYNRFIQVINEAITMIAGGRVNAARELQRTQAMPFAARLERLTNELVNKAEAEMVEQVERSHNAYITSQWVVMGVAVGSGGLALVLGYAISRSLVGPVKQMETRLQQIAAGDFSQWVEVPNRDELGSLGTNLNRMNDELKQLYELRERHIRFIRQTFGRYLSSDVVANLLDSPAGLALGGEKRTVTIMMSDLRGFTAVAERLDAQEVMRFLNRYLEVMVNVILSYHGTIIEILGDGMLVLFGAPMSRDDDPERAVACAVAMQLQMEGVNALLRKDNLPDIEMGIGIHTGEVVVGNIGSEQRTKYGVVGSAVNLTGRVESYTTGSQILISPSTYAATAPLLTIRQALTVEPKGVPEPMTIYDVGGISGTYDLFLPEPKDDLTPLAHAIAVRYTVLEGKFAGQGVWTGRLVKLGVKTAELLSDEPVASLGNLKMQLMNRNGEAVSGDLLAKVLGAPHETATRVVVRFTSVPQEVRTFLDISALAV
jgi:class 3 adenylate cyclase/HAMP domain-containing protein